MPLNPVAFVKKLYNAFLKDSIRLYRVLPRKFRFDYFKIFGLQFLLAVTEMGTVLVLAFFGLSMAMPEVTKRNIVIRKIFAVIPRLEEFCIEPRNYLFFVCGLVLFFIVFKNLVTAVTTFRTTLFSEEISKYIGQETLKRYLDKDYFWHISPESHSVLLRLGQRSSLSLMNTTLLMMYSNVLSSCLLFISLSLAEPVLTLVVVLVFSIVGITTYLLIKNRLDNASKVIAGLTLKETVASIATTRGIREVLSYRKQETFLQVIVSAMREGIRLRAFLGLSGVLPALLLEIAGFSTIFGVMAYFIFIEAGMAQIVAAASMLMLTAWRVLPSVSRVLSAAVTVRGIRSSAIMCLDLLEKFITEKTEPLPDPDPNFHFTKSIAIVGGHFRYPTGAYDALAGVDLEINKGESIGVIGLSGAGKSTLALVLTGLFPLLKGDVLVDGEPLTPERRAAYMLRMGFVPQTPFLMAGTLADNVAFSQWGQKYDRNEVERACRDAAMDFVLTDPKGIDIPIGENGYGLSGGQAQRVSIARVLFSRPDLIIFDEATSALDQASEGMIKDTISRLQGKITTVVIAHRLTTVEGCSRLVWMDKGMVRDVGSPADILPRYVKYMESLQINPNEA